MMSPWPEWLTCFASTMKDRDHKLHFWICRRNRFHRGLHKSIHGDEWK